MLQKKHSSQFFPLSGFSDGGITLPVQGGHAETVGHRKEADMATIQKPLNQQCRQRHDYGLP
jgi:hypothetical protein